MAKGSVEDYHPEHPEDREYFSDDDLDAIIQAAGGLHDGEVDHQRAAEEGSTLITVSVPRRIALKERLEDEAQKDAGAVSVPEELANGQFTRNIDILQPNGSDLVVDTVRGVYRLRNWSRALSSRTPDATPRTERHEGDPCLNELFKQLALIWLDTFERALRTSVAAQGSKDEGEAGGPLVRFIRTCLEPLLADRTPSDKAIRARICRLRPSLLRSSAENI